MYAGKTYLSMAKDDCVVEECEDTGDVEEEVGDEAAVQSGREMCDAVAAAGVVTLSPSQRNLC